MRTVCFAAFAALALTACGGGDETAATPGVGTAAAAPTPAGETAASVLVLTAGGLAVTGTMPRPIAFGTPKAEFVEAVNAVLGPAPLPESENAECPAGPVTVIDWNGLSATVQDDRFAGWLIQDGPLKTSSGWASRARARRSSGTGVSVGSGLDARA
jgi:hypothetical protein